jgi:lipopolysaccharide export system permease protein
VLFVLTAFLCLFAFFDLIGEMRDLGSGGYHFRQILLFVLLSVPTHAYELFPVSVLIGTLYVLAHLASNSEFVVMRAAGMSPAQAARMLAGVGLALAGVTFAIGEWVAPHAEQAAQELRRRAMSSLIGQDLQSGLWFKDERTFINVGEARDASVLSAVKVYEFDGAYRLRQITAARAAQYAGGGVWRMADVAQTQFRPEGPRTQRFTEAEWRSAVTPDLVNVLIVVPERMSAWKLYRYMQHLADNNQKTERYQIALWKKLFYPVATLVMMALALPFAYLQARSGMVGVKVFTGIMLGIFFYMMNGLFGHVGLLQAWPPVAAAAVPSIAFLLLAVAMMWFVERR